MKDASFFLVVRFSIEPQAVSDVMRWLDGGHVDEVLRQKGFLWCKRLRLGAHEFAMLYGIESRAAFEAYESNSALKAKFARERAPFEKQMRIERFFGEAEKAYGA
jgi:heme-degrading monooxygenase HmoA